MRSSQIFQRLLTAYQASRSVDRDKIWTHELVKVPLSIATENGSLQSGNKSMLVDVPTTDVNCPPEIEIPKDEYSCLVIDGQGSVAAFGKAAVAKTFCDYADRFVHHIQMVGKRFDCIDVTFDQYKDTGTSIKDGSAKRSLA